MSKIHVDTWLKHVKCTSRAECYRSKIYKLHSEHEPNASCPKIVSYIQENAFWIFDEVKRLPIDWRGKKLINEWMKKIEYELFDSLINIKLSDS